MTTLTPNERVTMRDFVRLKNIDRVAEVEKITRTAVKHRLGRVYVSIHAPARGATRLILQLRSGNESFNPRSRAGSDDRPI